MAEWEQVSVIGRVAEVGVTGGSVDRCREMTAGKNSRTVIFFSLFFGTTNSTTQI